MTSQHSSPYGREPAQNAGTNDDNDKTHSPEHAKTPSARTGSQLAGTVSGSPREAGTSGAAGAAADGATGGALSGQGRAGREIRTPHLKASDNLPRLSPSVAAFGTIPSAPKNTVGNHRTMPNRSSQKIKHPNQMPLIKMSTVSMASRQRTPTSRLYYNNYVENRRPRKVVTWDEATNSRPPLRIDMDTPGPCAYTPRNKPLYETNAPSYSFGRKTFVEKAGGSRTSWEKTWFQAEDIWTQKADFYNDRKWPTPSTHPQKPTVGQRLVSMPTGPHHTFGYKRPLTDDKQASDEPSPNVYDIDRADAITLPNSPAYSHSHRWGGTCLWPFTEVTPGPGTYRPERSFLRVRTRYPAFSIRGIRREKTHDLGPFAAF